MLNICELLFLKDCVCYFSSIFLFLTKWYPLKNYEKYLKSSFHSRDIQIFVFPSSPLFLPVSHCFRGWSNINLIVCNITNCLNKNLLTHFSSYLGKERGMTLKLCLLIESCRKIMEKSCRKYAPNASPRLTFNFGKWPKRGIACKKFF